MFTSTMAKVIFLNDVYNNGVPYHNSPIDELNGLKSELRGRAELRARANGILQSREFGLRHTTIDDVVEQQRTNAYFAGKDIIVLYPESGSRRFSTGLELIFPHNLDPEMSLATLVVLKERYGKGYQPEIFEDVPKSEFAWNGNVERLIVATLRYFTASKPFMGDRRGYREREVYDAAKTFMEAYESLKKELNKGNGREFKNFVLMSAFTATYNRIKETFRNPYFRKMFESSHEFLKQNSTEIDSNEILGYIGKKPVKKYMTQQELAKMSTKRKWQIINTELSKEPVAK